MKEEILFLSKETNPTSINSTIIALDTNYGSRAFNLDRFSKQAIKGQVTSEK
jgi:hypothetical protein